MNAARGYMIKTTDTNDLVIIDRYASDALLRD
jgi:hypothetical protein